MRLIKNYFKYFPAKPIANEGKITNTQIKRSLISNSSQAVSAVSGPDEVNTMSRPIIPKAIDAHMKTFVAIFCIRLVKF